MKTEILVIDDNADIRFLICNILQEKGYHVRSAANYAQAIREIKNKTLVPRRIKNKRSQLVSNTK